MCNLLVTLKKIFLTVSTRSVFGSSLLYQTFANVVRWVQGSWSEIKKQSVWPQASVHCELKWLHSKALSTLGAWEPLPGYRHKMVFTPWVHSYSISHCHTPFSNISLAASKKAMDYPRTNRKGMHTWCLCPLLVLTLYLGTGAVPEF